MSLDQLRSFVTVAEEKSVRKAAAKLCLTQPPVSRQILRLEEELGRTLFVRSQQGMLLSESGRALLPMARSALAKVDACARFFHSPPHDGATPGRPAPRIGSPSTEN